jgi:hypothetical protein
MKYIKSMVNYISWDARYALHLSQLTQGSVCQATKLLTYITCSCPHHVCYLSLSAPMTKVASHWLLTCSMQVMDHKNYRMICNTVCHILTSNRRSLCHFIKHEARIAIFTRHFLHRVLECTRYKCTDTCIKLYFQSPTSCSYASVLSL